MVLYSAYNLIAGYLLMISCEVIASAVYCLPSGIYVSDNPLEELSKASAALAAVGILRQSVGISVLDIERILGRIIKLGLRLVLFGRGFCFIWILCTASCTYTILEVMTKCRDLFIGFCRSAFAFIRLDPLFGTCGIFCRYNIIMFMRAAATTA